jgi:hypothetical protein
VSERAEREPLRRTFRPFFKARFAPGDPSRSQASYVSRQPSFATSPDLFARRSSALTKFPSAFQKFFSISRQGFHRRVKIFCPLSHRRFKNFRRLFKNFFQFFVAVSVAS